MAKPVENKPSRSETMVSHVVFFCFHWATDLLSVVSKSFSEMSRIEYQNNERTVKVAPQILTDPKQMLSLLKDYEGIVLFPDKPSSHGYVYYKRLGDDEAAQNFGRIYLRLRHRQVIDKAPVRVIGICGTDLQGQYPTRRWDSVSGEERVGPIFANWILPPDHPAQISLAVEQLLFRSVAL